MKTIKLNVTTKVGDKVLDTLSKNNVSGQELNAILTLSPVGSSVIIDKVEIDIQEPAIHSGV